MCFTNIISSFLFYFRSHFEYEFGKEVQCISRTKFVGLNIDCFRDTRSIIMDEVHHYRVDYNVPHWYRRAVNIVKGKGRAGQWKNGFLWLFLDMFQKENTFESGKLFLNSNFKNWRTSIFQQNMNSQPK